MLGNVAGLKNAVFKISGKTVQTGNVRKAKIIGNNYVTQSRKERLQSRVLSHQNC